MKDDKITLAQLGELIAQGERGRVKRDMLQEFLRDPARFMVQNAIAEAGKIYPVTIDCGKTIEQMVAACKCDWSDPNIIGKNFPISGQGVVIVETQFVHLGKDTSTDEVLAHMAAKELRPADPTEGLAFGATYPELQREFPIVCLGSPWVSPTGIRRVLYLDGSDGKRELSLVWDGNAWNEYCRFLAVRK